MSRSRSPEAAPTYRLVRAGGPVVVPELDEHQRRVVDHPGGPLLVLAGPGTGKTTTMVEAIVDRVERRGARPDEVLALTFSRKAAEQLRDRVTARLGRTTSGAVCSTFHSFAYGLIRRYSPPELYEAPLRLLSAPEQDVVLRELLADHPESVRWPGDLQRALGTRGFAREVQAVLSRAREKGLDGDDLRLLGEREQVPELVAAGLFLDQYLTNLDSQGATDYADLIRRATIEAELHRDELRAEFRHVFVDEYQDTDPGQVALLHALAGDGRDLVVVGDPHQSIYAFRGAEVRGILDFPREFPDAHGAPAGVVALRTTRRFGPRILVATQRLAARIGLPGSIDAEAREAFLSPRAAAGPHGEGRVVVRTFDTDRAEAEHLADLLRRAHLEDGLDWSDMAVLVRSGRGSIPPLRRALTAAGVPVEVASDEVPLVRDPAVLPLLDALRAVVRLGEEGAGEAGDDHLDAIDATRAEALLTGPLGGLDAGDLRVLARVLRAREKEVAHAEERAPRSSRELLRQAVVDAAVLAGLDQPQARRAHALTRLLASAHARLDAGATPEEVLWELWSGTAWPERLRRAVDAGGGSARRAHRDLDAICALFDVAQRAGQRRDHVVGVAAFLATLVQQQIPADTLAEQGSRGSAVRLLTAHRSKGLEWRLVVVAHVQQEGWPDLRRRSSILQADRIGRDGLVPPVTTRALLAEERRLFYVACTRARERLVVTAVASPDDEGEQPSRLLDDLGVAVETVLGRPVRPLSMTGLVSDLRRVVADPATSDALRAAAARRLALLARESTASGRPLVPAADPATWWGTRARTLADVPVRDPDRPVPISASVLDGLGVCPTQWFLQREAGGVVRAHQSANLGEMVHALAQRVAGGEVVAGVDDVDVLMAHVDQVWDRLEFRTPWSRAREHERVRDALQRFLAWHHANPRTLLATEQQFRAVVDLPGDLPVDLPGDPSGEGSGAGGAASGVEQVLLTGYADRLELAGDGSVVVVDLKTGRTKPTDRSVGTHAQLGLYQLAVDHGAVDGLSGEPDEPGERADGPREQAPPLRAGGAELVQLGLVDGGPQAVVQRQGEHDDAGPERADLRERLSRAARLLRDERFPAVAGTHCRDCSFVPICPAKSAGSVVSS